MILDLAIKIKMNIIVFTLFYIDNKIIKNLIDFFKNCFIYFITVYLFYLFYKYIVLEVNLLIIRVIENQVF